MTSNLNKCPSCGDTTFKEARQCPREDDKPVCINCCKRCRYYDSDPTAIPCRYNIDNPLRNLQKELQNIEATIKKRENYAAYFYRNNRPDFARQEEQKLVWIYEEKRRLLKEIEDAKQRDE